MSDSVARLIGVSMVAILMGAWLLARLPQAAADSPGLPPIAGDLLRGRTIIIDPGHGGLDPGSLGATAQEDEINLAIAHKLQAWFRLAGARVLLTWSKLSDIGPHRKYRVQDRVRWINQQGGDVLIDIHCNAGAPSYRGPQTFYWNGAPSYHLAQAVQEELQYFTRTRREVKRIDQYVLRHARMPAINVEVGFITNPHEEARLMNPTYQTDLSWFIFLGTERWMLKRRWPPSLLEAPPPVDLLQRDH